MKRTIWLSLLLLVFVGRALAQADCPTIVESAVQRAGDVCDALGRNQACYGNVSLSAELQQGAAVSFERAGDIISLSDVASFHLEPLDTEAETWGVALLKTQANLPDTLPGQNVTMLLFGQVNVTNAASSPSEATDEAAPATSYTPMQAFYFTSGIGDAPCAEAPDSGILIQTPEGVGQINLLINEVEIRLGSTAYLQAGEGEMTISVIEGHGAVTAMGSTVVIPEGTQAHIHLDDNSVPDAPPVGPEPYDDAKMAVLPLSLLPQAVTPAPSLTEDEIASMDALQEGDWTLTYTELDTCIADAAPTEETHALEWDGTEFIYSQGTPPGSSYPTAFFEDGVQILREYTREVVFEDAAQSIVMTVSSPTHIETVITSTRTADGCVEIFTYTYTANDGS